MASVALATGEAGAELPGRSWTPPPRADLPPPREFATSAREASAALVAIGLVAAVVAELAHQRAQLEPAPWWWRYGGRRSRLRWRPVGRCLASAAVEREPHRHHQLGLATSKELGTGVLQ